MWSDRKCYLVSLRLGIFAALIMGLFWLMWSFYAPVPVVTYPGLNFPISRWTDVIFAPLFVGWVVTLYGKTEKKDDVAFGIVLWLVFGLAVGLIVGLAVGLIVDLAVELIAGLALGLTWIYEKLKPFFKYLTGGGL